MNEQFASDTYAGICPEAWDYMQRANASDDVAYGDDQWTQQAADRLRELFATDCDVFFVFNGTAANSLSLAAMARSYHSVICHELAHIENDECGGPEFASNGSKLLLGAGPQGKLTPESVEQLIIRRTDIHYPKPKVISLTQATEVGTVYSPSELQAIRAVADRYGLSIHMDGARFANAAAALDVHPGDISWRAGVDVLCFSGTKNGLAIGEAIIFFNRQLAEDFEWRCKQAGQLCSKMRFISAPWCALLEDQVWLKNARHANDCASYLAQQLQAVPGIELIFPQQTNAIFVALPSHVQQTLHFKGWVFYNFIGEGVRFVCSWATTKSRIDDLVNDVRSALVDQSRDSLV